MSCSRLFEVEALRDGRVSGAERASIERHLDACVECIQEQEALAVLADEARVERGLVDEVRAARERRRLLSAFESGLTHPRSPNRGWLAVHGVPVLFILLVLTLAIATVAHVTGPSAAHPAVEAPAPSVVVRSEPAAGEVAFTLNQEPAREVVNLRAGTLVIAVDRRTHPKPLVITLPDGELEDIGTVFTVTVRSGATSEVRVDEGNVVLHLNAHPEPIRLSAGQSWTPHPPTSDASTSAAATPSAPARVPAAAPIVDPTEEYRAALALFDAGDYIAAAPKLARFATSHPDHVHGEDAAYLRVIAVQRLGDPVATQTAASDYLRAYPNGFRHKDVEKLAP